MHELDVDAAPPHVGLATIAREWGRIGCTGFGGPPAHIALLRRLCVQDRTWLDEHEFEDAIAATNLLPGPASTQLAIYCAWRLRGARGALVGGLCFIVPGLVLILALSVLFLADAPPTWVKGAAAGAGSAVPAVALAAALALAGPSWKRLGTTGADAARIRWVVYAGAGAVTAVLLGPWLVVVMVACGACEVAALGAWTRPLGAPMFVPLLSTAGAVGGTGALAWVALKVGALSYGGGFVIIPLMQHDAVHRFHWMTNAQFLDAVALGQVTPGPVVQTVAVVGYAAAGIGGGLLAATIAFAPSFAFVLAGGSRFQLLRGNHTALAFLAGAGPAVIGAIAGSTVPLARALEERWQFALLAAAAAWLTWRRHSVVIALVVAGVLGAVLALAGAPLSG